MMLTTRCTLALTLMPSSWITETSTSTSTLTTTQVAVNDHPNSELVTPATTLPDMSETKVTTRISAIVYIHAFQKPSGPPSPLATKVPTLPAEGRCLAS